MANHVLWNFIPLWNQIESGCGPTSVSLGVCCRQQWNKAHKTQAVYPQVEQRRKGEWFRVHV